MNTRLSLTSQLDDDDRVDDELYEDLGPDSAADAQARAGREGSEFDRLAIDWVREAGAQIRHGRRRVGVVTVDARLCGPNGREFWLLAHGNVDVDSHSHLPGMVRTDTTRKIGFDTVLLAEGPDPLPVLVVTSHLPDDRHRVAQQWVSELAGRVVDVVARYGDLAGFQRLRHHFHDPDPIEVTPAMWRPTAEGQRSLMDMPGWWQRDA